MSEPSNPKPGGARRDDAQRNDDADPRADDVLAAYRAANAAMRAAGAPAAAAQAQAAGANETHDGVRPLGARVTPPPERDGEAPRAQTRAAILAAAARAVDARPHAVSGDGSMRHPVARFRQRWPLALAASLLVGTLAWQLAAQFDETPPPREQVASAPATPVAPSASTSPRENALTPAVSGATGDAGSAAAADPSATVVASPARATVPSAPAGAASSPAARGVDATTASKPAAPAAPAPAPQGERLSADAVAASIPVPPAAPPAQVASAEREAPAAAAPAPADAAAELRSRAATMAAAEKATDAPRHALQHKALAGVPVDAAAPRAESAPARTEEQVRTQPVERRLYTEEPTPRPLAAWLERIAELRRAGRDAEADAELQALRRAYPQAQIPPALLKPPPR